MSLGLVIFNALSSWPYQASLFIKMWLLMGWFLQRLITYSVIYLYMCSFVEYSNTYCMWMRGYVHFFHLVWCWERKTQKDFLPHSAFVSVATVLCFPHPSFPFQPLHRLPSTSLCRLLQFGHSPLKSWDISASLMLSFPHWEPTWRPITPLDNACHKSSIGLSDTWGLSTRGNMLSSILFSSFDSHSPSFVPSFSLFMYWFRES